MAEKVLNKYYKKTPCSDCPYRKDATLRKWSILEFIDLVENDKKEMGVTYGCHKKDGHTCVGWLMDQVNRGLPSIALRLDFFVNKVTGEYLDGLKYEGELFSSIDEMCKANYPEHFLNEDSNGTYLVK